MADKCPVCGSREFIHNYERGETVCAVCGAIVEDGLVDLGPEWRATEAEERRLRARAGPPIARHTAEAFMTTIDLDGKDAEGARPGLKRKLEAIRLKRWQNRARVQTNYERSLVEASQELERLSGAMGIPRPCVERALEIYRAALARELNKGQPTGAMAAAALYAACRLLKAPRTLNELAKYTTADRSKIVRCYRSIAGELGLKMPPDEPALHISRIAGRLNLSSDVVRTAVEILQKAKRARRLPPGKNPAGVAAAALYLASKIHGVEKSEEDVATAADVAKQTVRNGAKLLAEAIGMRAEQRALEGAREGPLHQLARRIAELFH